MSKHKSEQRAERFGIGDKVDAKVVSVNLENRRIVLSIKALEVEMEEKAMRDYGSIDSGASLGDILGEALGKAANSSDGSKAKIKSSTKKENNKDVESDEGNE